MVDATVQNAIQSSYHALSAALGPTLQLLLVLYTAFFGVMHLTGRTTMDLWRTVQHLVVMVVISQFVTRWDFFALYIVDLFTQGPNALMSIVLDGKGSPNSILGEVLDRGIHSANTLITMAGFSTFGFWIVGFGLYFATLACVGYALYLFILSKIALGVLLGLAPLVALCYLFNATRDYCTRYLCQIVNFALVPILTAAILQMSLQIPQQALTRLEAVLASHSGFGGRECVFVFLAFFIVIGLLHQVTGIAASLSSGLNLSPGNLASNVAQNARGLAGRGADLIKVSGKFLYNRARQRWLPKKCH